MTVQQSPHVKTVTAATFEQDVIAASQNHFVLVDFWAPWCQPCQTLSPILKKLAEEYNGAFTLAMVNTDEEQMLSQQIGIRSLPTVVLLKDGAFIDQFMGALPESELRAFLDKHIGEVAPVQAAPETGEDGDALFAAAQFPEAARAYQTILEQDAENVEALLGLADSYLQMGEIEATQQILASLKDDQKDHARAKQIETKIQFATQLSDAPDIAALESILQSTPNDKKALHQLGLRYLLAGRFEAGLEQLLALLRLDVHEENGLGKQALREALDIVPDKALVTQYRQKMTALLF